jgi:hypothetical protein
MAFSRYTRDNLRFDGKGMRTASAVAALRKGIAIGTIPIVNKFTITQADRLDTLAGEIYGEARYWWVLAAASDVGWGLQVPPDTVIRVPDLKSVERIIG